MKSRDRRKLFSELRRNCRAEGIELELVPDAGAGSHGSLIFRAEGARPVRLVLAYAREITPGVQRSILRYLEGQACTLDNDTDRQLARAVRDIFTDCLK
jgi:hypothetical protein